MATNIAMVPPVTREQAFLETYFQCLSQFAYDKAKDQSDKERDHHRNISGTPWQGMVIFLTQFAVAEKTYASLLFLGQKWFSRRTDNLRTAYGTFIGELRKIEDQVGKAEQAQPRDTGQLDKLVGHLCGQLCHFLTARSKTMDFYEQLATIGTNRNMSYEDLHNVIQEIIFSHQKNFHHPILSPLKSSFSLECDIISHLLQAQMQMSVWQFLPTMLHLHDAHSKLSSWVAFVPMKETKKLGFGSSSKQSALPAHYHWLVKYKATLVSKFSLYFYETLSKQAPSSEMKNLMSKASIDFYGRIATFQRKTDAANISLILDTNGIAYTYKGAGYHHPKKFMDPPKGLDSFPAIFSYPHERPEKHWPSVVCIINDKMMELNTYEKVTYFYDEKLQSTYFMSKIEPKITFVIIFESKKSERDSYVNNFLNDFCSQIRCIKLFSSLRPGSKG